MRNHLLQCIPVSMLLVVCSRGGILPAMAQLEITNPPEDGTVVTEAVPIQATLGDKVKDGYVIFYLEDKEMKEASPIEDLRFTVATVADPELGLYTYVWDTRGLPDGEYKILAIGHSSVGEVLGQKLRTVRVQNHLPDNLVNPNGILFRYNLSRGRENQYFGKVVPAISEGQGLEALGDLSAYRASKGAWWKENVVFYTGEGFATVRNTVLNGYISPNNDEHSRIPLPAAGKFFTLLRTEEGEVRERRKQQDTFGFAYLHMVFPDRPMRIGDRWTSPIIVLPDSKDLKPITLIGQHTFEGIEWQEGYQCARIKSSFDTAQLGELLATLPPEEQEKLQENLDETGRVRMELEINGRTFPATIALKGERITYFAYDLGKLIKIDESCDTDVVLDLRSQQGTGTGGVASVFGRSAAEGRQGMMGPGMMMGQGMMGPGMMMGQAQGQGQTPGPGGGMMGPGMMMGQGGGMRGPGMMMGQAQGQGQTPGPGGGMMGPGMMMGQGMMGPGMMMGQAQGQGQTPAQGAGMMGPGMMMGQGIMGPGMMMGQAQGQGQTPGPGGGMMGPGMMMGQGGGMRGPGMMMGQGMRGPGMMAGQGTATGRQGSQAAQDEEENDFPAPPGEESSQADTTRQGGAGAQRMGPGMMMGQGGGMMGPGMMMGQGGGMMGPGMMMGQAQGQGQTPAQGAGMMGPGMMMGQGGGMRGPGMMMGQGMMGPGMMMGQAQGQGQTPAQGAGMMGPGMMMGQGGGMRGPGMMMGQAQGQGQTPGPGGGMMGPGMMMGQGGGMRGPGMMMGQGQGQMGQGQGVMGAGSQQQQVSEAQLRYTVKTQIRIDEGPDSYPQGFLRASQGGWKEKLP